MALFSPTQPRLITSSPQVLAVCWASGYKYHRLLGFDFPFSYSLLHWYHSNQKIKLTELSTLTTTTIDIDIYLIKETTAYYSSINRRSCLRTPTPINPPPKTARCLPLFPRDPTRSARRRTLKSPARTPAALLLRPRKARRTTQLRVPPPTQSVDGDTLEIAKTLRNGSFPLPRVNDASEVVGGREGERLVSESGEPVFQPATLDALLISILGAC